MPKYTLHSKQRKIIIKRFFWECPYIPEAQFFADNSYSTFLRLYSKWKHAPAKEKEKLLIRGKKSVNWEKKKKKKNRTGTWEVRQADLWLWSRFWGRRSEGREKAVRQEEEISDVASIFNGVVGITLCLYKLESLDWQCLSIVVMVMVVNEICRERRESTPRKLKRLSNQLKG